MKPSTLLLALAVACPLGAADLPATAVPKDEAAAAARISADEIRGHVRFLSSDLLEGRGPATRGDLITRAYIAAQMEGMGLQPGAPDGSWFQPFDIVGVVTHAPDQVTFSKGSERVALRNREEIIAVSGGTQPEPALQDAEVVFVGYGITAPEYQWDDFKGADLKGKVLLMMNNDPEDDPKMFAGRTRLYYGRWGYKYEQAAKVGAAGAIIIHTIPSAGYAWQVVQSSWSGEQFALPQEGGPQLQARMWTTEDASRRLAKLGGQDLDALRAAAQKRDFKPVPLGVTVSLALHTDVHHAQTANVIGRLPGRDAVRAREAVFYTAHHDHLGLAPDAKPGEDAIYNGALDNASGIGVMLAIARAMTTLPEKPARSVVFAAVAAEEQGLLGSQYLAAHPPIPAGRIAADINIDGMNIWGRTHDITMVGFGKSSLDAWIVDIARGQGGRVVNPDQFPEKGFFYRSDQFSFAKQGVPSAYFDAGVQVLGKPDNWGREQQQAYEDKHYHQPSDELQPWWDLSGAVEDAQLFFHLGVRAANAPEMPRWNAGDEFEAARKKAIAEAAGAR